jgi:hypothetical protein
MKPRWLLLAVSVICLLLLAPATALSQQTTLHAGCGTADIDGRVRATEWANAATVPLFEGVWLPPPSVEGARLEGVAPAQDDRAVIGTAYFMHDGEYLYVGAILEDPEDKVPDDPTDWDLELAFAFEDEPAGNPAAWVDCAWEAESCDLPEDEGMLHGDTTKLGPGDPDDDVWFGHWAAEHVNCEDEPPFTGVAFHAAPLGAEAHYEMRVNLETSPLNNVAVGDCFDLRWIRVELDGAVPDGWRDLSAGWPSEGVEWEPYADCTILCLDPCAVEFVPEPGTIMLLGSGLAGLAGYATLRLRSGQALRWRARE